MCESLHSDRQLTDTLGLFRSCASYACKGIASDFAGSTWPLSHGQVPGTNMLC